MCSRSRGIEKTLPLLKLRDSQLTINHSPTGVAVVEIELEIEHNMDTCKRIICILHVVLL